MTTSRLRLCLLQPDTPAPDPDGAVLFPALRRLAAEAGHGVVHAAAGSTGIRLLSADGEPGAASPLPLPQRLIGPDPAQAAYHVLQWLREERFDIVIAPACSGLLFYALNARHQGLALQDTALCTVASGLTLLSRQLAGEMPHGMDDLVRDEMERGTLALSDLAWALNPEIESWVARNRWTVPGLRSGLNLGSVEAAAQAIWTELVSVALERPRSGGAAAAGEVPLVSVCIPHFNRPGLLLQAIDSIRRQTYPNIEIVVVDDASTASDAQAALLSLEAEFARHGGRLVRHETRRFAGAARNTAARHARGEFLLFLDDDAYAKPDQVATLVLAAQNTGAGIVTACGDRLSGDLPPDPGQQAEERWLALGNVPAAGMFRNLFGTACALFHRTGFEQLGGFGELRGEGREDWDILARASLAGMNLQALPQAVYWYRRAPAGTGQAAEDAALAACFAHVPAALWPVLRFAHGAGQQLPVLEERLSHCESLLRQRDALLAHHEAHIAHLMQERVKHAEQRAALERRIDALSEQLLSAETARGIMLGGYGTTPQAAVDAVLGSTSWRIANSFQAPLRRLTGAADNAPPTVTDWQQAAAVINLLRQSSSWELTGPLRALLRWMGRG